MEVEREPRDRSAEAGLGTISLLLAVTAVGIYVLSLLLIGFIILFPQLVPDDAPGLGLLAITGPPASLALGVLASLMGLGCLLLRRKGRVYAAVSILVGASMVALTAVLTLRPWEVLEPLLGS